MDKFEIIADVIKKRRTVKPAKMNGKIIPDEQVKKLLELADWAPTHKHTEPWRFIVYADSKAKDFVQQHAELYRKSVSEDLFNKDKYEKILANQNNLSHLIICAMKRDEQERVPEIEEISAASAAVQNLLIAAEALGISSFWSTGGMTHSSLMKDFLGLSDKDRVIGLIYLGYSDSVFEGKRVISLDDKINWK